MKYSYNWLKELSGTKKSAQEIADLLTIHAFEIEGVEKRGSALENVIVGEIVGLEKHPNADRLQYVKVNVGDEVLDIVCGAHNIAIENKVPVAMIGAVLPNGLEIKKTEIRGVTSHGMLCAEDELGLGMDHSGILLLDPQVEVGTLVSKYLELDDSVIEIDVLSNRAHDALSHVGMAREIAALEKNTIEYDYDGLELDIKKSKKLDAAIEDKEISVRYIGVRIDGVTVKQSPQWVKNRLIASGLKPINTIVDATNYVMLELGQPLHAFDAEKIGSKISVRRAKDGEKVTLLDESEKTLSSDDIVIADEKNAIALAGIMGGVESAVSEGTTSIVLEAAQFNSSMIRRTRMRLGLATDAAIRFEKNIDPNIAEKAMERVIELITAISGGEVEGKAEAYVKKSQPWNIELDTEYVNRLLGIVIPQKESESILSSLGMKVKSTKKTLTVTVPSYRLDLKSQEDLIEEIGRVYGYSKIEAKSPVLPISAPERNERKLLERKLKETFAQEGFTEIYTYSFYGKRDAGLAGLAEIEHLELENPMNPEQEYMRISLLPNVMKKIKENLRNFDRLALFELGRVYWPKKNSLPDEKRMLVAALADDSEDTKIQDRRNESRFFELKSYVSSVLDQMGVRNYYFDTFEVAPVDTFISLWHQGRSAAIRIEGLKHPIGFIGEIHPLILSNFGIATRVAASELYVDVLEKIPFSEVMYESIPKFPYVRRDLSMTAQKETSVSRIINAIRKAGGELIRDVEMFDAFKMENDQTSYAFHIDFGSKDRTLISTEIDTRMKDVIELPESELKVLVRK